ncbi:MAG: hypothetical protein JNK45_06855 [Myxococcales bacterium]|nr:hypothetical protein [Myxococcales bacterium]
MTIGGRLRGRVDRVVLALVDLTERAHRAALELQARLVSADDPPPPPATDDEFDLSFADLTAADASSEEGGPQAEPPAAPGVLPPFEIPRTASLEQQMQRFADSVMGATGSYAAFIADMQGLPIVSRNGSEDQIALTAAIDRAMVPIRESLRADAQGSIALEIDRHNVLQAIWVNTPMGRFAIGLVLPQSLGGEFVESIRAQFIPLLTERQGASP